jgi:aminopeptidase N
VATACQGEGAHVWWPTKDHQSDEPDSMLISVSVPKGLKNISNGRLRKTTKLADGYTRFDWFVGNPINNYDVAVNIADYVHFADSYDGEKGKLTLDYWVLPQHLEKAKKQFGANVKPMLKAFEYWFGPYPFYSDGFKLIETPHLGMEHQSGVAYGNKYMNGYLGRDLSGTGKGLSWDYIVIHEAGHEWFGNNVTASDIADMWIQEGFTTYSEGLFVDYTQGKEAGAIYINGSRRNINNDGPIAGVYHINQEGSGDMYPKGAALLHMIRTIINDDAKWREVLRGIGKEFYHKTILRAELIAYINKASGRDFSKVFEQYLLYKNIPTLEVRFQNGKAYGRWVSDVAGLDMPVRLGIKGQPMQFFEAGPRMKEIQIAGLTKDNIEIDTFNYYIGVLVQ